MNPFLKHDILRNLPYELMKTPEKERILRFVEKKRRKTTGLAYFVIIFGVVLTISNLIIYENEWGNYLNLFNSCIWLVWGTWFLRKSKNITVSPEELDEILSKLNGKQNSA